MVFPCQFNPESRRQITSFASCVRPLSTRKIQIFADLSTECVSQENCMFRLFLPVSLPSARRWRIPEEPNVRQSFSLATLPYLSSLSPIKVHPTKPGLLIGSEPHNSPIWQPAYIMQMSAADRQRTQTPAYPLTMAGGVSAPIDR